MAISGGAEYAHEQQAYHAAMAKAAAVKILRARALAAKKKSISYQQMMQRNQQASNKQRAQEKIEYTRGPYGYLGSYFSDLNFKEAEKTNETASLVSMYKNANANFNAWQLSLKSVFGTENYNTALSKYNSILTVLNTDEANLKSLETNYSSALSTANTAIQNAKINNGMVTVNGGGISIPLFLENLGFKSLPYGSKLSTSQVELPGVGSFSAAAPAGFYNANVGTWAFHPNQFNEIESTAKSADNLFATAQSQQSILNAYVNANNQLAKVDQLISALPAWGQQSILSEISGHPSASTSWFPKNISTIQINPSQNTTSATSSQLTAAAGTSIGSSFLSDIGSAFHTLTNPSTYTSLPGEIANGLGAAGSTLTNPQSWIAAGNSIYSAGKTAVKTGETIVKGTEKVASLYENTASLFIGDITQGYKKYIVTPNGAIELNSKNQYMTTPTKAEEKDIQKKIQIEENLLPSQISGQVLELQSQYSGNWLEQLGLGLANSQGNLIAAPAREARRYGILSPQFLETTGISAATIGGEAFAVTSGGGEIAGALGLTGTAATILGSSLSFAAMNTALTEGEELGVHHLGASPLQLGISFGEGAAAGAALGSTSVLTGKIGTTLALHGIGNIWQTLTGTAVKTALAFPVGYGFGEGTGLVYGKRVPQRDALLMGALFAGGEFFSEIRPDIYFNSYNDYASKAGIGLKVGDTYYNAIGIEHGPEGTFLDIGRNIHLTPKELLPIYGQTDEEIANNLNANNVNPLSTRYALADFRNALRAEGTPEDLEQLDYLNKGIKLQQRAGAASSKIKIPKKFTISLRGDVLPPEEEDFVTDFIKKNARQFERVYGTTGAKIILGENAESGGDIDSMIYRNPPSLANKFVEEFNTKFGEGQATVSTEGNAATVSINGNKLLDLHLVGDTTDKNVAPSEQFGQKAQTEPVRIEKVRIGTLRDTILNKAFSVFTPRIDTEGNLIFQPQEARFEPGLTDITAKSDPAQLLAYEYRSYEAAGLDTSDIIAEKDEMIRRGLVTEKRFQAALNNPIKADLPQTNELPKLDLSSAITSTSLSAASAFSASSSILFSGAASASLKSITSRTARSLASSSLNSLSALNSAASSIAKSKSLRSKSSSLSPRRSLSLSPSPRSSLSPSPSSPSSSSSSSPSRSPQSSSSPSSPPRNKSSPSLYFPVRHNDVPPQLLYPFKENPRNRRKRQLQMLYAPFPDLLDVNEVANTGKKPIALNPSNPKTYKIYRKEMMQSGGLRYRTYNQLFGSLRKKGKKKL